jgi:hypothetical protein
VISSVETGRQSHLSMEFSWTACLQSAAKYVCELPEFDAYVASSASPVAPTAAALTYVRIADIDFQDAKHLRNVKRAVQRLTKLLPALCETAFSRVFIRLLETMDACEFSPLFEDSEFRAALANVLKSRVAMHRVNVSLMRSDDCAFIEAGKSTCVRPQRRDAGESTPADIRVNPRMLDSMESAQAEYSPKHHTMLIVKLVRAYGESLAPFLRISTNSRSCVCSRLQ